MTIQEETLLKSLFRNKLVILTPYSLMRMRKRHISVQSIYSVLKRGKLVEFHYKDGDFRVLVRGTHAYYNNVVCVVYSILTKEVITVFCNSVVDRHSTLDYSLYNKHLDIIKILRSGENVQITHRKRDSSISSINITRREVQKSTRAQFKGRSRFRKCRPTRNKRQ